MSSADNQHFQSVAPTRGGIYRLLLVGLQLFVLQYLAAGMYSGVDLPLPAGFTFLAWFPSAFKSAIIALICTSLVVLASCGWRNAAVAFMLYRPPAGVYAANAVLCLFLIVWLSSTPPLRDVVSPSPDWRILLFSISPAIWVAWGATTTLLLIAPKNFRRAVTLRSITVCSALFAVMLAYTYSGLTLGKNPSDAMIMLTMRIAEFIYGLTGGAVTFEGYNVTGQPVFAADTFRISMAPSCAGTQGITLATLAALLFIILEYKRLRVARVLMLVPLFAGLTFLINAVRIASLLYIGEHWSPEVAVNGFHSNFGVVSLSLVSIIFAAVVLYVPTFRQTWAESSAFGDNNIRNPTVQLLAPLAALIGVSLLTGLLSGAFYWLYPVHTLAGAVALYWARQMFEREFSDVSVFALVVGVVIFIVWVTLVPHDSDASTAFANALYAAPVWLAAMWLVFRIIGSVVVVPLAEELAFRGVLQDFLAKTVSPHVSARAAGALAILGAGTLFALVHANIAAAFVAGIGYGIVYRQRSRLGDAILAHAVTNFLIAVYVLMLGRWSYW